MHDRARVTDLVLLTLLVALALAWPLAAPPIGTHGEAREGLVVQDVVARGHWVLPHRNGEVPSKPPLFHWIAAATAALVGLSDAVVRFPSALAAWSVLDDYDLKTLNPTRMLVVAATNGIAVVYFVAAREVWYAPGLVMLVGGVVGGYAGARLGQRLPPAVTRSVVIAVTVGMTLAFFERAYF